MLHAMRSFREVIRSLGGAGAAANALAAVERDRIAMAEVDSVVARLHRHVVGKERPAA